MLRTHPCSCTMLGDTRKLCRGIAHDHLRHLPRLKATAVAAIQDVRGLVARGSHSLPSKIPHYLQRLMGKETAPCPKPARDISSSQFSTMDLTYIIQGERALQQAPSILLQHTSRQAETTLDTGAAVSTASLPGLGRVFLAEVVLALPVEQLNQELLERVE